MMILSPRENIASSPVALPEELVTEILSSLKVKSLLRFKCVNKSWNSLISNPFFVKMHLTKSSHNPHFLLSPTYSSSSSNIALHNPFILSSLLENPSVNLFPEDSEFNLMENCCHIIGSCNGFTCLVSSWIYSGREIDIHLWNPATRWFQKLASFHDYNRGSNLSFKFSFGYDNLTDKYKVVAFCPNEVRVFTMGDNVWRNIPSFPTYPYQNTYTFNQLSVGVYSSNSLNWFALLNNSQHDLSVQQFVIISLDLGIETYTHILFPQDYDQVQALAPSLCVLMECLCFSCYSTGFNFVIWQMKEFGVQDSWTKLLKLDYQIIRRSYEVLMLPLHVFENGDALIFASNPKQLILFNSRENRVVRQTTVTNSKCISWFNVNHYVESLLSTN